MIYDVPNNTVSEKLKWFRRAEMENDTLVLYKSITETDNGYFYCPYVPMTRTRA